MDLWDEGASIAAAAAYDSDASEVEETIEEGDESDDDDEMVAEDEGLDSGWSDLAVDYSPRTRVIYVTARDL